LSFRQAGELTGNRDESEFRRSELAVAGTCEEEVNFLAERESAAMENGTTKLTKAAKEQEEEM